MLGNCYYSGRGVSQDFNKAFEYYQQAAKLNHSDAIYKLGLCYKNGKGVSNDINKAIQYYQQAADLGNQNASNALSRLHQ
jgi:TPR repeat protein